MSTRIIKICAIISFLILLFQLIFYRQMPSPYLRLIGLVGIVLLLFAVYKLAKLTKRKAIFTNYLIFTLIPIPILILAVSLREYYNIDFIFDPSPADSLTSPETTTIRPFLKYIPLIFWIVAVIMFYFKNLSLQLMAKETEVSFFRYAGYCKLFGAIGLILLGLISVVGPAPAGFSALFILIGELFEYSGYINLPGKIELIAEETPV